MAFLHQTRVIVETIKSSGIINSDHAGYYWLESLYEKPIAHRFSMYALKSRYQWELIISISVIIFLNSSIVLMLFNTNRKSIH